MLRGSSVQLLHQRKSLIFPQFALIQFAQCLLNLADGCPVIVLSSFQGVAGLVFPNQEAFPFPV